jgi:hypothetical protein
MKDARQKQANRSTTIGALLVGTGILALLGNLGWFSFSGLTGALVLGALGLFALNQYYSKLKQTWLLLSGFVLLGAGAACITGSLGGAYFLAITGLGFLMAFREDERQWWALMPAGLFFTLGAVAAASTSAPWLNGGVLFFAGVAATFGALHLLPGVNKAWAIYPALGSAALAVIVLGTSGSWVMPVLFIAAGLYLLNQNGQRRYTGRGMGNRQPVGEQPAGPIGELPAASSAQEVPQDWLRPEEGDDGETGESPDGNDNGPDDGRVDRWN